MALINTSVPNLIQGVSQQPDATRFAGQCEEQENALSSVAEGLKKRPNTRHIARLLTSAIDSNSFVHFINRSDTEKYVVIHDGTYLCAYNITTGNEASIQVGNNIYKKSFTSAEVTAHNANDADGNPINTTTYVANGYPVATSYLASPSPIDGIKGLTVADTTFLLNTGKSVALNTARTDAVDKEALVFIKQGDYKKKYQVDIVVNAVNTGAVTPATVTANISSYRVSFNNNRYVHYFRWRIDSVTITNAGSGYTGAFITFDSTEPILQGANYTVSTGNNGEITSVDIVGNQKGEYEGTASYVQDQTTGIWTLGATPPTITATINTIQNSTGGIPLTAFIWSGTSYNSNSDAANTDYIAQWLSSDAANSGFNAASDKQMNVSDTDATGNSLNNNITNYFTVEQTGSLIKLTKKDDWIGDFSITTTDSLGDSGMGSIYKEVSAITDLPARCYDGFKCKVIGDSALDQDDYYVKFQTNSGASIGDGSWIECEGFDIEKGFDSSTMPFSLINDDVDTFKLSATPFAERLAGDNLSNPNPSFVSNEITNMFFFKNRLGLLSRDNVIFSEAGLGSDDELGTFNYNFYRTTVSSLLDSAPIDVSVSSRRVTTLEAAVGFQENLVLFSRTGQFVLKGGDLLTPKTVSVIPATNFDYDADVAPLPLGSYIYYPFKRGAFTGLREFTVNSSTDNYDSVEITEHVPAYVPSNIKQMKGTTSEDMIALVSEEELNALYVYNYFWNNNQKVLSAWSKFNFTGEIRGIEFIESTLYAVIANNGETHLVELPLESGLEDTDKPFIPTSQTPTSLGFVTHLDMRVASTVANGNNQITLPYTPADNAVEVYTTDGLRLNCTNSGATVTLTQAVTADTNVFVGIPYTMKYTFSEQLFKAKAGNGTSPSNAAKLLIRNASIYFDKTAHFKVKVTPKFRDAYENIFTPDVIGSTTIGTLNLDSGFYRFPVLTKAQDTKIEIENDSALPSNFQSAEFESFVHSRSNRYG